MAILIDDNNTGDPRADADVTLGVQNDGGTGGGDDAIWNSSPLSTCEMRRTTMARMAGKWFQFVIERTEDCNSHCDIL